jgi:hypothetical protein
MPLDINLFRNEPDVVKASQKARFSSVEVGVLVKQTATAAAAIFGRWHGRVNCVILVHIIVSRVVYQHPTSIPFFSPPRRRQRMHNAQVVDEIIGMDEKWRKQSKLCDEGRAELNK